jgi:hypothetical protein
MDSDPQLKSAIAAESPMSHETNSSWKVSALPPIAMGGLLLSTFDYFGLSSDHYQYLLPSLRNSNSEFAAGDWFLENTEHYHYVFQFLASLAADLGLLQAALLGFHLLSFGMLVVALGLLLRACRAPSWSLVLVLFTLVFGTQRTWGDVDLIGVTALPHYLGLSSSLLALTLSITRRPLAGILAAAACLNLHFAIGCWTVLLIALLHLIEVLKRRRDVKDLVRPILVGSLLVSPLIISVALSFLGGSSDPDAFRILFFVRSPHHYDFAGFGTDRHFSAGLAMAIVLACCWILGKCARGLRTFSLGITGIGLISAFFLHVVYWPLPARLFPWRMSPLIIAAAAISCCAVLARSDLRWRLRLVGLGSIMLLIWDQQRDFSVLLESGPAGFWGVLTIWAGPVELAVLVGLTTAGFLTLRFGYQANEPRLRSLLHVIASLLILEAGLLALGNHRDLSISSTWRWSRPSIVNLPSLSLLAAAISGIFLAFALHAISRPQERTSDQALKGLSCAVVFWISLSFLSQFPPIWERDSSYPAEREFADLVNERVPAGEQLLIPPDAMSLRFLSGRAVVVDFKAFPMTGSEMEEWMQRLELVSGRTFEGLKGSSVLDAAATSYDQRSFTSLQATAAAFNANYLVVDKGSPAANEVLEAGSFNHWSAGEHLLVEVGIDDAA